LVWLKIIDHNIVDIRAVNSLHNLRGLGVNTYCRTHIDFSNFPDLEVCSLEWRPGARSLFQSGSITSLWVNNYSGLDLADFGRITQLRTLRIANAPARSLAGLSPLDALRRLELRNLTKLKSLSGIESLQALEELAVLYCRNVSSLNEIAALRRLRRLDLLDDGELDSLRPLSALDQLSTLHFYGDTTIVDGDLTAIAELPNLSSVRFGSRSHYSYKLDDFPQQPGVPLV
jgi:hypothetical protein